MFPRLCLSHSPSLTIATTQQTLRLRIRASRSIQPPEWESAIACANPLSCLPRLPSAHTSLLYHVPASLVPRSSVNTLLPRVWLLHPSQFHRLFCSTHSHTMGTSHTHPHTSQHSCSAFALPLCPLSSMDCMHSISLARSIARDPETSSLLFLPSSCPPPTSCRSPATYTAQIAVLDLASAHPYMWRAFRF